MTDRIDNSQSPSNQLNSRYPVNVSIDYPEQPSRFLALLTLLWFVKMILLIPHLIAIYILSLFSFVAIIVSQLSVLFKGTYPRSLFALNKGLMAWQLRMNAYFLGMTDKYPPLEFDAEDKPLAMTAIKKIAVGVVIVVAIIIVLSIVFFQN